MKAFIAFFLALCCSLSFAAPAEEKFCDWTHPGANKYQGQPVDALQHYYMDPLTRATLQSKMVNHWYDDIVEIRRDGVFGNGSYSNLRDMHYGKGHYCPGPVDTRAWGPSQVERALVYCVASTCIAVPTVCNNVSLIDRAASEEPISIEPAAGPASGAPQPGVDSSPAQPGQQPQPTASEGNGPPLEGAPPAEEGPGSSWPGVPIIVGSYPGAGGGSGGGAPGCGCTPPPVCPPPVIPPVTAVPEPAEWTMLAMGLVCFLWCWNRRQK